MATVVWPELTNIQDEDVLRRMWQETEDLGRRKEIRARMYKVREQRLKDFYTTGDTQSEVTMRKSKTHTESIGDQGSFLTMKTKEIRDSESPTRDISSSRRGDSWSSSYTQQNVGAKPKNTGTVQVYQPLIYQAPAESIQVIESSAVTSDSVSSQRVAQSSSVQTSKVSSQSIVQSRTSEVDSQRSRNSQIVRSSGADTQGSGGQQVVSSSEIDTLTRGGSQIVRTSEVDTPTRVGSQIISSSEVDAHRRGGSQIVRTSEFDTNTRGGSQIVSSSKVDTYRSGGSQIISDQDSSSRTTSRLVTSAKDSSEHKSEIQRVSSESQRFSSESTVQHGGEQVVTSSRTVKQSHSGWPEEAVTSTVTTYTTGSSQPSLNQNSVVQNVDQNRSGVVETRTIVKSEPQIIRGVTESVTRSQQVQQRQQTSTTSHSSQSVSSSVQKVATSSVDKQNISKISNQTSENDTTRTTVPSNRNNVSSQDSSTVNESQSFITREQVDVNKRTDQERRSLQSTGSQNVQKLNDVKVTEVTKQDQDVNNRTTQLVIKDNKIDETKRDSIDTSKKIQTTDQTSIRNQSVSRVQQNDEARVVKSSTSSTDQKILNEIQKLDTFLSTQPTPSNSVPISPQSAIDTNWPVDKEFVYTDTSPRDKVMVNGERSSPVKHPSNLELPKGATEGQYVTTYQHDYSPRISRNHDTNHQYFASTLRASPDRSSPSPSKRSSSKGSLDRSTPDRKFRGSPTRKTPDNERRLSSSSYTIERISDNKRYTSDVTGKSQTLPKDSKPKRKLSSTQTKATNKTRVSTPGASPTTSPTRVQRGRKPSLSDSDSDHSNATFNKSTTSLQKKSTTEETKKYGSTTRIRGSSTSVNVTDNETRPFSSPSPTRYPAREHTPDYSSEGSITRELRTARNIGQNIQQPTLDSSPERSAFSPIKSFRTSPERKDHSLNLINEERKHILETTDTTEDRTDRTSVHEQVDTGRTNLGSITITKPQDKFNTTPSSSPERKDKDVISSSTVITETTTVTKGLKHPSPERQAKIDKTTSKRTDDSRTVIKEKSRTPLTSPERKSPSKPQRNISTGSSLTKPKYSSPSPVNYKTPDYPKVKSNITVTEKTSVTKTKSKTTDGDRITRRSSIPRADIKRVSPREIREPDRKRPGYSRDTPSSTTRITTATTKISPVVHHTTKTTNNKTVDRTVTRDTRVLSPKKYETPNRPINKRPDQNIAKKPSPTEKSKPKGKTPSGVGKVSPVKAVSGNVRVDVVTKTTTETKRIPQDKPTSKKPKKEIIHTDSKEILKTKLKDFTQDDKESSDSIEDEQPPEEFFDIYDRDTPDRMFDDEKLSDSTVFKNRESDVLIKSTCETRVSDNFDSRTKQDTINSTKFINAEQNFNKPYQPGVQGTPKKRPDTEKSRKPRSTKKPESKDKDDTSSSSSDEEGIIIRYDDYSELKRDESDKKNIIKREVVKDTVVNEKKKDNTLKVSVQHPKSSRESSPEKSIPMSVTSDGGQTPRFADFVTEPEDVEIFDASNLGPNRPIPSTILEDNRIPEESDDNTQETKKVSVAERVSKYNEKTNKIDIVTLDTTKQTLDSPSDVLKTKELFENIRRQSDPEPEPFERRGSKKFSGVDEFIQKESENSVVTTEISNIKTTKDVVDKPQTSTVKGPIQQPQSVKSIKSTPKRQPSIEDVLKNSERRLSEHSPDMELKKAFFEKKSNLDSVKPVATKEPLKSHTPFDQKIPNYMKATATAATRKETIQREFAPGKPEGDQPLSSVDKRNSIDIQELDAFIRSESYDFTQDTKTPVQPTPQKSFPNQRRTSTEIQQLDTFKKSEAYISCDDRSKNDNDTRRRSTDSQKTPTTTDNRRKQSQTKSPERAPTRKTSKDKSTDRLPLKKKDTNIMPSDDLGKTGVTTKTTGPTSPHKPSQNQIILPDHLPEIEQIFNLHILEILLSRAVQYDERRRIRAQIRIVKKDSEKEENDGKNRRPQTTTKVDRGVKEDVYQRKVISVDKSVRRTPSPVKEQKSPRSPERSLVTTTDKKDTRKGYSDRRISDRNNTTEHSVKTYVSLDNKYSPKDTKTHRLVSSPETRTTTTVETISRKSTPYPMTSPERKSTTYQSRIESHTTSTRRSPERRTIREDDSRRTDTYTRTSQDRRTSTEYERKTSKSSPERKTYDTRRTSETIRTHTTTSPERRISTDYDTRRTSETFKRTSPERRPTTDYDTRKTSDTYKRTSPDRKVTRDYDARKTSDTFKRTSPERRISKDTEYKSSYTSKTTQERTSEVRRNSKTSPERKVSTDYDSRRTSEVSRHSRTSPDRRLSTEVTDSSRSGSHTVRTTVSTTTVGRKGEDSITSSYGVGPTDDQGRPLFGLRALRSTHRASDESEEVEVGEDIGDGLVENVRGSDGRPLFGLKALKSVTATTTTTTSSSVTCSDMPSTQHLVQKHQQFLSEVKSSEDKLRNEVPRARLRDSFILDSDEGVATSVVPALPNSQGLSLKSIIQKHEDMASTGKNVRREVQSTKTVTSSHGTVTSDGKVSMTKQVIHGEMRGKDGADPTGKITTSHYSYRSGDDPSQKPHVTSTTTTSIIGSGSQRNSVASLGEVRIEEIKDSDSRRDSLVSSAKRSLENKQKDDFKQSEQTWQADRKSVVKGDSIKALQHKFQQPTVSSALKCVGGEETKSNQTEERITDKDDVTRITSKTTSSVTSASTRRDSGNGNIVSSTRHVTSTTREGGKSATSFLDDTSKVTGVQDILQRMRNADLVTESTDSIEDSEARSLLNKFLGASVILQGMEAGGAGPASSALVSQVERQRILTSTQRKTDDIDNITDEKQLQILLEACSDYEQRRKIRARLRKIMAVRKGDGDMLGAEGGEERRDEFCESRQITSSDDGSFTKTEVHKTSTSTARLTKANSVQQSPFAKFRQLERQNSAPSGGVLFKLTDPKLVRSASTIKDRLLCWARAQTSAYKNVQIDNFSTSWSNGLAFCALIHHFYPDAFDYNSLTPESRRHNFELAFRIAQEKGDIYPLLDVEDMVAMRKPDWKCVFTYVQSIYRRLHNQPEAVKSF